MAVPHRESLRDHTPRERDVTREWDEDAKAEHEAWQRTQVSVGMCPASGLTLVDCRALDVCDCFGWPNEEQK